MVGALNIFASDLDEEVLGQIQALKDSPVFSGSQIAIMPDAHLGAGCVIGFTAILVDSICPNVVGVDIGCGVMVSMLPDIKLDLARFDENVRKLVPLGMNYRKTPEEREIVDRELEKLGLPPKEVEESTEKFFTEFNVKMSVPPKDQIGTLGGGNHFIEIGVDPKGRKCLIVHSGSRNFGKKIADLFQEMAVEWGKECCIPTTKGLEFFPLDSDLGVAYLKWTNAAQLYAAINRMVISSLCFTALGIPFCSLGAIDSVHNFIDIEDRIVRKGAIRAHLGEPVAIPLSMSEGTILGAGRGNIDFNLSAPHGAGRRYSRSEMRRKLQSGEVTMEEFQKQMKGIYSTSVSERTIDESPMAYKTADEAWFSYLSQTVRVHSILKPIYNLKAEELSYKEQKQIQKERRRRESLGLDVSELES
jgi:tRNA-splicing ligase RtcB